MEPELLSLAFFSGNQTEEIFMAKKEKVEPEKMVNSTSNRAWIRALIIISIFTVFSLACSFIFVKLLPSKISVQIKTVTDIFSLGGGVAIFYIIFKLLYSSFKKLLPFLILLMLAVFVVNLVIFIHTNDRLKSEVEKLEARTELLDDGLKSTNSELNQLKFDLDQSHLLFMKVQDRESVNLMVRIIRKNSSVLICRDLIMKNKILTFPLDKIHILSENENYSIIRVPYELYVNSLERPELSGPGKSGKRH
jgi:phosphopantetheine adenylyltransferase